MKTDARRWKAALILLLLATVSYAQTETQKQKIRSRYDQSKLSQLQRQFTDKDRSRKQEALRMAAEKGWEVLRKNTDGTFDELMAVSEDGLPIYYTIYNVDAARSTRTDHLHSGGSLGLSVDGQNMTAHVWDGGPTRPTHQEFDGPGGNNRVTINDGATTLNGNSFHAQHVTGTIVASGVQPNAKGMAPQARALTHDWNSDLSEASAEAAAGMLVSNHSYGFRASLIPDWYFGAYIGESRDWDNLMFNSPYYLMVVAAGNDGNDNSSNGAPLNGNSSFDKLNGHSTSKNNMVVANGRDASINADGSLNSVTINSSSSEGPTDDLRIKPDITGNGTGVYSTYDNNDAAYNSISGTSMASPNVAGTLLVLQQHYNNINGSFMRAATLKGLALHSADDAGIAGPDAVYGWGLLNARAAAQAISQNGSESKIEELTLNTGQSYQITVESDGVNPLVASISWTDRPGTANTGTANLTTPVLVNDLDVRVSQGTTTYSPYRLTGVNSNATGDNDVDPYERVDIAGAGGTYTITVTHKGSLTGGSQNYSLIVTGLTGIPVVCNATVPAGLGASNIAATSATLAWNVVPGAAYDLRYRESGTTTWTTVNDLAGASTDLTGLTHSTTYEVQVRSQCPDATTSAYSSSVTFTTTPLCGTVISTFPYSESFETGIGNWTQETTDDLDWTRDANGTPSNGTGPSSAVDGTFYLYIEASGNGTGYPNKNAIITTPCFDVSALTSPSLSFSYHMNGTSMGNLVVETSTDGGSSWSTAWSVSGSQGTAWNNATVALPSSGSLQIRFNGTTGSSWSSDIVIDAVNIGEDGGPGTSCPPITFSGITPYGSQDVAGDFQIQDGGATLFLENNTWKYISFPYTVTANTVLEFEFRSTGEGEIHGIGFDNDNAISSAATFRVYGVQNWGITNFDNYTGTDWVQYSIPVGSFYTGAFDRLFLVNDNDAGSGNNSYFRNVKVHEGTCSTSLEYAVSNAEEYVPVIGNEGEFGLYLYPNPVHNELNVMHNLNNATYSVLSISGRVISTGKTKEMETLKINTSLLKSGIYLLRLQNSSGIQIVKFQKR